MAATEQAQALVASFLEEPFIKTHLDQPDLCIMLASEVGETLYASDSLEAVLGYSHQEFLRGDWWRNLTNESRIVAQTAVALEKQGKSIEHVSCIIGRDASYTWLLSWGTMYHGLLAGVVKRCEAPADGKPSVIEIDPFLDSSEKRL